MGRRKQPTFGFTAAAGLAVFLAPVLFFGLGSLLNAVLP